MRGEIVQFVSFTCILFILYKVPKDFENLLLGMKRYNVVGIINHHGLFSKQKDNELIGSYYKYLVQ